MTASERPRYDTDPLVRCFMVLSVVGNAKLRRSVAHGAGVAAQEAEECPKAGRRCPIAGIRTGTAPPAITGTKPHGSVTSRRNAWSKGSFRPL